MKKSHLPNLTLCIILDVIGCTSYLLPFFGEAEDLIWAPISGIIFYFLFGRKIGILGGVFSFLEEISPGLDFIPTFTIAWFIRRNEISKVSGHNQVQEIYKHKIIKKFSAVKNK